MAVLSECPNREFAVLIAYMVKTVTYSTAQREREGEIGRERER
jgi:hypothetical protein